MTDLYSALGLAPAAEVLYTELVGGGPRDPSAVATATGLCAEEVDEVLKELERSALVVRDSHGVVRPCPPRAAVELWAAQREVETMRARLAGQTLARAYAAARRRGEDFVEVVQDHESTVELVRALRGRAQRQVRGLVRGPGLPSLAADPVPEQVAGAARGVSYRTVYDADVVAEESRLREIARAGEMGEQSRSFAGVPLTMLVSDDEIALIVLPGPSGASFALAVYRSGLLDALIELFESFWRIALPVGAGGVSATGGPVASSAGDGAPAEVEERRLMQLLATGLTDGVVARTLGVSERTVHRRLSRLQQRLGVQSRFQLGVHAARQGWI